MIPCCCMLYNYMLTISVSVTVRAANEVGFGDIAVAIGTTQSISEQCCRLLLL